MITRVNEICKRQGIFFKDLAEKIGITDVGLRKSLNGNPTIESLQKIADALNVHISELFTPPNANTFRCPKCGISLEIKEKEL